MNTLPEIDAEIAATKRRLDLIRCTLYLEPCGSVVDSHEREEKALNELLERRLVLSSAPQAVAA